jgi:hypothetical protein
MQQQGKTPRNHARDNQIALIQKQKENRQLLAEAEEASRSVSGSWKLKQFRDIKSKIASEEMTRRRPGSESPRPSSDFPQDCTGASKPNGKFLLRGSLNERLEQKQRQVSSPRLSPRKDPVKQAIPRERAQLAPRRNTDFIKSNRTEAAHLSPPKKTEQDAGRKHEDFGAVPLYLRQRKEQWAEKERTRAANQPDPNCPPGMVLMEESERVDTLRILGESEKEAQASLFKLPLQATNPSAVKRREAIEAKLREIEAAKKIFSKEKVYIAG